MDIAAIRLFVCDLAPARAFYAQVLGLKLTHESAQLGFCTFESRGIHIVVETVPPDAPHEDRDMVGRFTGVSFAVPDIAAEHARLVANGVHFTGAPEKQGWGGWLATFADPAGNQLSLVQYPD